MTELVERMRAAARQAGVEDDGPPTPLLEAFMLALTRLGASPTATRGSVPTATALAAALDQARRAADAETGRFRAGLDTAKAALTTEAGLRAACNDGPTAARDWLNLMTWNDPEQALAQCHGDSVVIRARRRACMVPLWIEKPISPLPPQGGQ